MDDELEKELDDVVVIDEDREEPSGEFDDVQVEEQQLEQQVHVPDNSSSELAAARAEIAQLRALQGQQLQQQNYTPQPSNMERREQELYNQQDALVIEYENLLQNKTLTTEKHADLKQRSRQLTTELNTVAAERALERNRGSIQQAASQARYNSMYSDVKSNPKALRYGRGQYEIMVAKGAPDNEETVERAMNEARIEFGMIKGKPTANDRAQLMGTNGGGGRRKAADNTFKFDKSTTIMANSMFGDQAGGDVELAQKMWAKKIGIPARKRLRRAGR